jgi:hypothetical protein
MIIIIFVCNLILIAMVGACCYMIHKKSVTKISFEKKDSGVYLMDARHEKAIQDKMEVDE